MELTKMLKDMEACSRESMKPLELSADVFTGWVNSNDQPVIFERYTKYITNKTIAEVTGKILDLLQETKAVNDNTQVRAV